MAARPSWTGAIELGGFPVNVTLFVATGKTSGGGFRMLSPVTKGPVKQKYIDSEGGQHSKGECLSGIETAPDQFAVITPEALEMISSAERTKLAEPAKFCPLDSIDLELNLGAYKVFPDSKVPAAEQSYKTLWSGLHQTEQAYVTQIVMRAGSADALLAFYAKDDGIYAVALPYQMADLPELELELDEKAGKLFEAVLENVYDDKAGAFDRTEFRSEVRVVREKAIAAVLDGKDVEVPEAPKVPESNESLMAALEAQVKAAGKKPAKPKKAPAKKSARKKVAA